MIEHGHSEHHMFVIQILKQVPAVGVADVSRELEAGVQKSVGVVAHQHGIPVVGLAVAPQLPRQLQTGVPPSAMRPLRAVLGPSRYPLLGHLGPYIDTYVYIYIHIW